jgi:hypothetical protein
MGYALSGRVDRGELKPKDFPNALAKIKKLISPPKQHRVDHQRLQRERDSYGQT